MFPRLLAVLLILVLGGFVHSTGIHMDAQPCYERNGLIEQFRRQELSQRGLGITKSGNGLELWVREETDDIEGTFYMLRDLPDGRSCVVDRGEEWIVVPHKHYHTGPRARLPLR